MHFTTPAWVSLVHLRLRRYLSVAASGSACSGGLSWPGGLLQLWGLLARSAGLSGICGADHCVSDMLDR